eukprot:8447695-Pyramimonas_sp.AAC.2
MGMVRTGQAHGEQRNRNYRGAWTWPEALSKVLALGLAPLKELANDATPPWRRPNGVVALE